MDYTAVMLYSELHYK